MFSVKIECETESLFSLLSVCLSESMPVSSSLSLSLTVASLFPIDPLTVTDIRQDLNVKQMYLLTFFFSFYASSVYLFFCDGYRYFDNLRLRKIC